MSFFCDDDNDAAADGHDVVMRVVVIGGSIDGIASLAWSTCLWVCVEAAVVTGTCSFLGTCMIRGRRIIGDGCDAAALDRAFAATFFSCTTCLS